MRHSHAAWSNEIARSCEVCLTHVRYEVVSEVSAIGQVKNLEDRLKVSSLADPEVLRDARVKLEEGLAAEVVEPANCT